MSPATPIADRLNDPVALHMRSNVARLRVEHTVAQALESLREQPPEGRIVYFYVTDEEGRLQGVVPTRRLLLEATDRPLESLMVRNVIAIPATASVVDACEFFMFHRLLAFPVVDDQQRLLGSVDVELYTDELSDLDRREGNDELFQLIGVHRTDSQQAKPWSAFRSRFPWLLANIAGGVLAAFLSGFFEAELRKAVALALFIPVVLALAESVSIQSVSLSLKSLGRSQPTLRSLAAKLRTELLTGTFLGVACGVVVASVALVWIGELPVVACLLGGITIGVAAAAVIGVATPGLLRLLQREPQVAAGPVALATTDMVTLLAYFSLARWLLA
ncbi:MAG: CBS domain-containing protein [Pirellulales bacterium]